MSLSTQSAQTPHAWAHASGEGRRPVVLLRCQPTLMSLWAVRMKMCGAARLGRRAVYILGAEDAGLPASVVRACAHCVSLDGVRASSYNVATAGAIIMYDRLRRLGQRAAPREARHDAGTAAMAAEGSASQPAVEAMASTRLDALDGALPDLSVTAGAADDARAQRG
jgi:tRNA C32,U32 (ribose-2'-O)-methylase TrmJ